MHISPRSRCQRSVLATLAWLVWLTLATASRAESPAPTPPAWQRELDSIRLLQNAAVLVPAKDPAAAQAQKDQLLKLYIALGAKYPDQAPVQRAAGDYCETLSRHDLALPYWQRAESLDPRDGASADALGNAALGNGDTREARRQFQLAVDARPGTAEYHFELANVLYLFRHELAEPPGTAGSETVLINSLAEFRQAADLAPLDARLATAYAESFYILAKPDWNTALAAWLKVRTLAGADTDIANGHLARVSLRLGRPDDADHYLDAIQNPGFAPLKAKLHAQADKLRAGH